MTLAPSLYNFQLSLSQVDKGVEHQQSLKVARHPSETMERVWLRVLAFCWQFEDRLEFGPGLSDPDHPDLITRDYTNRITRWIRVGRPDPLRIQKEVDQNSSAKVVVLFDSPGSLTSFIAEATAAKASRIAKAELAAVSPELLRALQEHDDRRAKLTVTFVGDHFYIDCNGESLDGALTRGGL